MDLSLVDSSSFLDVSVAEAGRETCIADKNIVFTPKPYATLHYVYAGRGIFTRNGVSYRLKAGDCFLIRAGDSASYQAEKDNPWSYLWVGLGGSRINALLNLAGFSQEVPVLHDQKKEGRSHFEAIYESYFLNGKFGLDCLAEAYALLDKMVKGKETPKQFKEKGHIQAAKAFIANNYQFKISILDVARSIGVSPNYLANLFKREGEENPKTLLTRLRMEEAARLLSFTSRSITEVAISVGYPNPLHFSKAFHAYYGLSPQAYRQENRRTKDK